MGKKTVTDLFLERFDKLEAKVDRVTTDAIPNLLVEVAKITTDAKKENQFRNRIYAAVTIVISVVGLAVACLK